MNERIFQCSGKEEIEELLDIVSSTACDTIIFQFPRNSILFQQKTNLQSLHATAESHKKTVIIVTQNARARKEIQSIGIQSIASIEEKTTQAISPASPSLPNLPKMATHPIDPEKFRTHKIPEDNSEIIQKISKPSLHALFLLGILAIALFIFIIFLSIPSANISIVPHRKETEMHMNVELLSQSSYLETDVWKASNGMFMVPVETTYEYRGTYTDVFKKVEGDNAKGQIEIINTTDAPIMLKQDTRVQTNEGLLYTLPRWVQVKAKSTHKVNVVASDQDIYRKVQADRANIPKGTLLLFPGLSLESQKKIYATSAEDFAGGSGTWRYSVNEKNIIDAKKEWTEMAKKQMDAEIEKKMNELKKEDNKNLRLITPLEPYAAFEVESFRFDIAEETLIGQAIPAFSGSIKVKVKAYAYTQELMENLIRSKFERLAPDGMKLLSVNMDLLSVHIQTVNSEKNRIKANVSTRGIYEFIVEPKSEKAVIFIENAKKAILGKSEEEAKVILLNNFKEISDVNISLFPFWVSYIPSLPEKITFTIEQ